MSLVIDQAEDLRVFEQRLMECISSLQPDAFKWKVFMVVLCVWTFVTGLGWLTDSESNLSLVESLVYHKGFSMGVGALAFLLATSLYQKALAPQIVARRCRSVLKEYNMSCDDSGRLIVKRQRPNQSVQ
ncbi:nuclear envelope phosphatase-regulatory subunit 1-like [Oscarella lobularis]|uniref:nuclear envelope phosphatase-regulatory subunit 1-like n=1 Tax=Oscarella lobularis TaxID=121494 RepID=UPI0033132384